MPYIPYTSKNDIKDLIERKLEKVSGLEYQMKLNSKALRILVSYGGQNARIEINVLKECPSIVASTTLLCSQYGMTPRVVRIMSLPVSFAHKIAAWNERRLMRDLYDVYQYATAMKVQPDAEILHKRLLKTRAYHGVKPATTMVKLKRDIIATAGALTKDAMLELVPLLPQVEIAGLEMRMQISLRQLVANMQ